MKRIVFKVFNIIFAFLVISIVFCVFYYQLTFMKRLDNKKQDLICTSISPTGEYIFKAYLYNGGATVDYAVIGEIVSNKDKTYKNVYFEYHRSTCKVSWINEKSIKINDIFLEDVETDTYNYKKDPDFEKRYNKRLENGDYY